MGFSKTMDYTKSQLDIAKYAKALAHPARIAIIQLLIKKQTCICGVIVEELPISQSTVSQHLKELKDAGLIKGEIEGTAVCYCLDEKEWGKASGLLKGILDKITIHQNKCC